MSNVVDIAAEILSDLQNPADLSVSSISFWITSNIGALNSLLDTNFTIENLVDDTQEQISPTLEEGEKSILKVLFESYYVNRLVKKNLGAAAYTSSLERREGNRLIKTVNKNEVARNYQIMSLELSDELTQLILAYKINKLEYGQVIDGIDECGCECGGTVNSSNYRNIFDRPCYDLE